MLTALTVVLPMTLLVAACGSGGDGGGGGSTEDKTITMWTLEDVQSRIDATKKIAADYTAKTGNPVEVVAIAEDQFNQLITAAAGAGKMPDVVAALGLAGVQQLASDQLLDTDAAGSVVKDLDPATFSPRALKLTQSADGKQLAVPSDGWAQLLLYRKDLFKEQGLAAPDSYAAIEAAASKLNSKERSGIALADAPGDSFTQQTFEHLALANGCQLVGADGAITLTSPNCVQTFDEVGKLAKQYGPAGNQDVDTTRATYFAGKTAMTVWSSFILDELAGLRKDALPTCPECRKDPTFLAKNTGFVTALTGPSGSQPAQYGEVTSWSITDGASATSADFVKYMMSDAYLDWLALAPEGKVPVRNGTPDKPTQYSEGWANLEAGVDTKAKLSDVYGADTLTALQKSPDTFQRWAIEQGQGALAGAILAELPVPKALNSVVNGQSDPTKAAATAQKAVEEIAKGLK